LPPKQEGFSLLLCRIFAGHTMRGHYDGSIMEAFCFAMIAESLRQIFVSERGFPPRGAAIALRAGTL
jgi:hypothetical protein